MPFTCDLTPWLRTSVDRAWLEANVHWKDFGNGNRLGKLKREDGVGLVLYHVAAGAPEDAFSPHTHTGGEAYLVLDGEVYDDDGTYPKGSLVWMKPGSRHTPRTRGDTLILVLWPGGVEA
jgi:anti-sigma factor ChrR (cupin superfamily)